MPFPNFHSARQRSPDDFDPDGMGKGKKFKTTKITDGITAIIGKLKGNDDSTTIQTYRFDKEKFTAKEAKSWLKKHSLKIGMFEMITEEEIEELDHLKVGKDYKYKNGVIETPSAKEEETLSKKDEGVWAEFPGSWEDKQRKIRDAMRSSTVFGTVKNEWDLTLEATTSTQVIVSKYNEKGKNTYYIANWELNDKGVIEFSDVEEVEAKVVVTVIAEMKNEEIEVKRKVNESRNIKPINEIVRTDIAISEEVINEKTVKKGYVKVAQKAGVLNKNKRMYSEEVLSKAVEDAKQRIVEQGPLFVDWKHRTKKTDNGQLVSERDLRETVALIHDLNYHKEDGTVSLDDIRFVETQAGNDIVALLEGGAKLDMSQRADGSSVVVKNDSGEVRENVTSLFIDGWDFLPTGKASVSEAKFEIMTEMSEEMKEINNMPDKSVATIEDLTTLKNEMIEAINGLKRAEEKPVVEPKVEEKKTEETTKTEPIAEPKAEETKPDVNAEAIKVLNEKVDKSVIELDGIRRASDIAKLRQSVTKVLTEELSTEPYKNLTKSVKELIISSVDSNALYGKVDLANEETIKTEVKPLLDIEIDKVNKMAVAMKLEGIGFVLGQTSSPSGIVIVNEAQPYLELYNKIRVDVEKRIDKSFWRMPDNHESLPVLEGILKKFDEVNHNRLLLEANEQVTQLDIGVKVAIIARSVIDIAWRMLSALELANTETMGATIENIMIKSWLPVETAGRIDTDMAAIEIAETGTMPTAGVTYVAYPLLATRKAIRTFITSYAKAVAKGTPMNPEADAIAGLAQDVARRIDRLLYQLLITKAQMYSSTAVSTWETLTRVGATNEYESVNRGWMKFEWVKVYDANLNPTSANLQPLFHTTGTGTTLQKILIQNSNSDAFTYATHYTINYPDGSVTLTAAGVALLGAYSLQAKYEYTSNLETWSIVPDTGITLYDWLPNLRYAIAKSRATIKDRNYEATRMAVSHNMEALMTSGPQFTELGRSNAEALSQFNQIVNYAGLSPIRSSAVPDEWIPICEPKPLEYRIHTPWSISGPIKNADTGDDYYLAEEWSGSDCPLGQKVTLVGIRQIQNVT